MKQITGQTPYGEILKIALVVREDIDTALQHLDQLNLGMVRAWLERAKDRLPEDTDHKGIQWYVEDS